MRCLRVACLVLFSSLLLLIGCAPATAEVKIVATSPATATPEPHPADLIYVVDPANGDILSHVFAIDAHQPRIAFALKTRMLPEATLSHDGRFLYIAESYLSAVTRGQQLDVYSVYDAHTGTLLEADLPLQERLLYKAVPAIGHLTFFLAEEDSRLFIGRYGDPEKGRLRFSGLEPLTGQLLFTAPKPPCDQVVQAWADRWLCLNEQASRARLVWVDPEQATSIEELFVFPYGGTEGFALTADGRFLFVIGRGQPGTQTMVPVWQYDLETETFRSDEGILVLPGELDVAWQGITLAPDGSRLFVSAAARPCCNLLFDAIYVFDTQSWEQLSVLKPPQPASHLAVSVDGETLYVLSPEVQQLSYYDVNTLALQGTLSELGEQPFQLLIPG